MADDPEVDADLDLDIRLRAPRVVGERMIVLAALCRRGFLERSPDEVEGAEDDDDDLEDAETERFDLVSWLRDEGLDGAATPAERKALHTRVGRLPGEAAAQATWSVEALLALAWAAALVPEPPAYGPPTDSSPLLAAIPAPWQSTRAFLASLALRPEAVIAAERERAELWYWRAGVEAVFRQAAADERADLRAAIRDVARDAANHGLLRSLAAGDFSVDERPVGRLSPEELDDLTAAAVERLRALNWVCGFGATWDDVPTDL